MSRRMKADIRKRKREQDRDKELARLQKYDEACDAQCTECFHERASQVIVAPHAWEAPQGHYADPPADREVPMFQACCALTLRHFKRWTRDALVVVIVGGVFNVLLYHAGMSLDERPGFGKVGIFG